MAKIKLGALAGQVSGSIGCYTFGHNRGGPYIRLRNLADRYATQAYAKAHERIALASANWKNLTDDQRHAWTSWASSNPVLDTLGERRPLTGNQAYVMLTSRLLQAQVPIESCSELPPGKAAPTALSSLSFSADIGTGTFQITFTPTPTGTGLAVYASGCESFSPARLNLKNQMRFIGISPTEQTSPGPLLEAWTAALGSPSPGAYAHVSVAVIDSASGLMSLPLAASAQVTNTP